MAQIMEEALSHSVALKMGPNSTRKEADERLNGYLSDPLGTVIKLARKESLLPEPLQKVLETFRSERNWLVHKCVQIKEFERFESNKTELFQRIAAISKKAQILQRSLEEDMVEYCTSKGKDMSGVRAAIQKYYEEC